MFFKKLKVFTSNDFKGHYPVGTSAIIVAKDETRARELLEEARPLAKGDTYTMDEVDVNVESCNVLQNGDY